MWTLKEISQALSIPFKGNGYLPISGPSEPGLSSETSIAVATDSKFFEDLRSGKAKAAVVLEGVDWKSLGLEGVLIVKRSRYALSMINSFFEVPLDLNEGVHPSAIISMDADLGENVIIGAFSIVGANSKIGCNTIIANHVTIGSNVEIGQNSLIHHGVRVGERVKIGNRFICQANSVIGSDGFSYVSPEGGGVEDIKDLDNKGTKNRINGYARIASLGSVLVGDDVEIGSACTIDRGTLSDTRIGSGSKLDNLVHIAHNVNIGTNCLLCGQVGIAGSACIGDRAVLGGQVGVADHVKVGEDSIVAGKSGVSSNVPPSQFMMGNPAVKIENNISSYKALRRLPRLYKKIQELEKFMLRSSG